MSGSNKSKCITCGKIKANTQFYRNLQCVRGHEGECKVCWRMRSTLHYNKTKDVNSDAARRCNLKKKYNITLERYEQILTEQGGVCSICGKLETTKFKGGKIQRLSVDHCHETGIVRGLLCRKCNTVLSAFDDDIDVFASAISYLLNSKVRKAV